MTKLKLAQTFGADEWLFEREGTYFRLTRDDVRWLMTATAVEPSADGRDAARYRYLRDDHAYEPEEQGVRGGSDLDALCDAGNAENR